MAYFTLALCEDGQWSPQFGDFDKECVEAEREEYRRDYPAKALKIIKTKTARQADVNAAIASLNDWRN